MTNFMVAMILELMLLICFLTYLGIIWDLFKNESR